MWNIIIRQKAITPLLCSNPNIVQRCLVAQCEAIIIQHDQGWPFWGFFWTKLQGKENTRSTFNWDTSKCLASCMPNDMPGPVSPRPIGGCSWLPPWTRSSARRSPSSRTRCSPTSSPRSTTTYVWSEVRWHSGHPDMTFVQMFTLADFGPTIFYP